MRLLCFICGFLLCTLLSAQDSEISYDPDRPLTWDDFSRRVGPDIPGFKAYSWSGMRMEVTSDSSGVYIQVDAYFVQNKSWVVKGSERPDLLHHEQRHFDLTELHTRRLRVLLAPYQKLTVEEFVASGAEQTVQDLYNRTFDEMNAEQKRYDQETNHSIKKKEQAAWDASIAQRLAQSRRG